MHWRRKWQLTPVFLPGESQGRGSLVGCHLWGRNEQHDRGQQDSQDLGSQGHVVARQEGQGQDTIEHEEELDHQLPAREMVQIRQPVLLAVLQ